MHIDWASLISIAVVAAASALALVMLVSLALVGLSIRSGYRTGGPAGWSAPGARPTLGTAVAALCIVSAALIVGFGLYLILA